MPNVTLTQQLIVRRAVKRFTEDTFIKTIFTGHSDDFDQKVNGYATGQSVDIRVPITPTVYDGAIFAGGGSAPDNVETKVRLTLDTEKHVPMMYTAKELTLDIEDFDERFIKPSVQALISRVQVDLLERMKNATPNVVGTWGTIPTTRRTYSEARASLQRFLAPDDMRCVQYSSDANTELSEANSTLFNSQKAISSIYSEGRVGEFQNFDFFENQSIPLHTMGAGVVTGYLVNGVGITGSNLTVDTGTGAITKGTIFTIANVFATHPITGLSTGKLRQFVVTADYAGGAGNIPIYPALVATSASVVGTVNALPADNAAVTLFGVASQSRRQNLAYHKNAFVAAFAPKEGLPGTESSIATNQGVSLRLMHFGDGYNDKRGTRLDVLYGFAATRPDHAVRITE